MYKERREKLIEQLPQYSITVFKSGTASYNIGDEMHEFDVDRTFYYYTGLDNQNLNLVFIKLPRGTQTVLYIEPFDPVMAKWVGGRIQAEEATEISGIEDVRFNDTLEQTINGIVSNFGMLHPITLCGELSKMELTQSWPVTDLFNKVRNSYPDVMVRNICELTHRQRMVKDEEEIRQMKKAIAVTNAGIKAMMLNSREGIWENELEAYFDFVLKSEQCGHAFHTICASGKNATILHYGRNNCKSNPGDMVLIDLGASWKYYNADISRTFPINGIFSERQKEIYELVLKANKYVQSFVRPGITTREITNRVIEFYKEELPKVGLLQNGDKVSDYFYHGVSHHIGLETHDVSLIDEPLQAGNVISNEPGLYLENEGIGVRIEDDLLITEDGCICLSEDIMKETEDIENFMRNNA